MGLIVGYVVGTSMSGGLVIPNNNNNNPTPTPNVPEPTAPKGTAPDTGVGPVLGDSDATVTIVEFTDFQCPFCARHYTQTFGQIKTNYIDTGKVKYELRNYPLTGIHPQAMSSAEAALCAHKQGKFWPMHDELFETVNVWGSAADPIAEYKKIAATLGLNAASFASCLENHETQADVQADMTAAGAAGISGTPGFWVIGPDDQSQFISGAQPYTSFQSAIDGMLN